MAAFSASATSGVAPLALNFSSTSTGSISTYAWTFGDGTTSSSVTPAKVYSSAGVYTVSLTVTGPGGSNTLHQDQLHHRHDGRRHHAARRPDQRGRDDDVDKLDQDHVDGSNGQHGVTAYYVERCQNAGCTAFAQIGSVTGTYYQQRAVAGATYQYRVRAVDAAGNLGGYSAVVAATTSLTAVDKTPPSVPGSPSATAITSTSVDLKWTPSTDDVGVSGYILERCRGRGASGTHKVAKTATQTSRTRVSPHPRRTGTACAPTMRPAT